ncbi:unnamed protein product [Adineta ricciae]|uniref:Uncharacterized protein n=1 Tax=Adineta ricciae TaxID=249248 RepID=A0A815F5V7_ADIRI|nr:unnamed protein product [Adineta ricciae]
MSSALKEKIFIETNNSKYCFQGYPSELSVNSFIEQKSFQKKSSLLYDQMFTKKTDFNPRAHRDDRQHSKFQGLNQAKQEKEKSYPSRSSSQYGRRINTSDYSNDRSNVKIEHLKKDFYRNNGISMQ